MPLLLPRPCGPHEWFWGTDSRSSDTTFAQSWSTLRTFSYYSLYNRYLVQVSLIGKVKIIACAWLQESLREHGPSSTLEKRDLYYGKLPQDRKVFETYLSSTNMANVHHSYNTMFCQKGLFTFWKFSNSGEQGRWRKEGCLFDNFLMSPSVLLIPYFLIQYWYIVFLLTSHSFHWPFQLYSVWLNFQHFLHCYRFSLFLILFFISFLLQNTCSLQPMWKPKKHKNDKTLLKSRIQ